MIAASRVQKPIALARVPALFQRRRGRMGKQAVMQRISSKDASWSRDVWSR
jgi:hypothetical protein